MFSGFTQIKEYNDKHMFLMKLLFFYSRENLIKSNWIKIQNAVSFFNIEIYIDTKILHFCIYIASYYFY